MRRRDFITGLSGAAAWPVVALGQQSATLPVIGFLNSGTQSANGPLTAAFLRGLGEQGYVEGRNVAITYRWANTEYDRLPALASDLVRNRVAVIASGGGVMSALAAKAATTTIPIVFQIGGDPVAADLVASLSRPGRNATGVTYLSNNLLQKRLELLHLMLPAASTIGFVVNPASPVVEHNIAECETAARALGIVLEVVKPTTPVEIEQAFEELAGKGIRAVMVDSDVLFYRQTALFAAVAARYSIATSYGLREWVEAGGLMSYGASAAEAYHLVGSYVGRILRGEKVADLPVQQSSRIETVINLKTAKALGLTIPVALLGRADEVIE
jgi:putative tryptophan/tyrosine transport system substrate-binding protein